MSFRAIAQYELPQCITATAPPVPHNFMLIHSGNSQCSTALEISNLYVPIEEWCSGCISCCALDMGSGTLWSLTTLPEICGSILIINNAYLSASPFASSAFNDKKIHLFKMLT